jgi:DNA modification methylase
MSKLGPQEIVRRNNTIIKEFTQKYSLAKTPIEVSFRELLPEIKNIDRYTHLIHAYPAKLLVHIPYLFVNNTVLSRKGDKILDPFNGSGTVMLESLIAKKHCYGADANPLARLIAEAKITSLNTKEVRKKVRELINKAERYQNFQTPDVVNCKYWFSASSIKSLSQLLLAINKIEDDKVKRFMLVCFSNCVKKVSYADPRISVPVKLNPERYENGSKEKKQITAKLKALKTVNVFKKFQSIAYENINRLQKFETVYDPKYKAQLISNDARNLRKSYKSKEPFPSKSIKLIITSPPYAGAQKYIRSSSLNLGWTGLATVKELIGLDDQNIGRENYKKDKIKIKRTGFPKADKLIKEVEKINPDRANIVCTYLLEMKQALNEMIRVLKKDGHLVLIVGNNKVCDKEFNVQEYFSDYLTKQGLNLRFKLIDDIKSYGLMTKRNKTADIISREWILVFKKTK